VAIRLKAIELACNIPTTIQTQFVKCATCAPLTKGLSVLINRGYNALLLLMGVAPLALPQPNYAEFREQQAYFIKSVRESGGQFEFAEYMVLSSVWVRIRRRLSRGVGSCVAISRSASRT
jgi:hypothetical protein